MRCRGSSFFAGKTRQPRRRRKVGQSRARKKRVLTPSPTAMHLPSPASEEEASVSVASSSLSNGGTWNSWNAGTALLDVEDRSERLSRFLCTDCGVADFSSISDEGGERESARNFHACPRPGPLTASGLEGKSPCDWFKSLWDKSDSVLRFYLVLVAMRCRRQSLFAVSRFPHSLRLIFNFIK